eukprot:52986_1
MSDDNASSSSSGNVSNISSASTSKSTLFSSRSSTESIQIPASSRSSAQVDDNANINENEASLSTAKNLISLFSVTSTENTDTIQLLPIFMYPKLKNFHFLTHFKSLTQLEIIFCKLTDISALSKCNNVNNVEILNLSNNKIKDLNGIQNMMNLKELHVGENKIISLDKISSLTGLNVLDFHDNLVEDLQPISHFKKLHIIRGGNNKIYTIKNYLNEMQDLERVNLSANYLLHFDEIDNLAAIPKLKHLQLNDPHFGSNPICDLSNYHVYSLYKLIQIESLDGIKIDAVSKQKAQISMCKKKMFYQILYNCQKRDDTAFYKILSQTTLKLYGLLQNNIKFAYKYKNILNFNDKTEETETFIYEIDQIISKYHCICDEMWDDLQSIKHRVGKESENRFEILKCELKTAGNLRLIKSDNNIVKHLIKCKILNVENANVLNAMKIEHKFSNYIFNKSSKKIRNQIHANDKKRKNNRKNKHGNDHEIEMDNIFVIDDSSIDSLFWVLNWNNLNKKIKIKPTTIFKSHNSEQQTFLFVKAFFNKHSTDWKGIADKIEDKEEWIINSPCQLQPLYLVQLVPKNNNENENATQISNKWRKHIYDIFNCDTDDICNNMSSFF